MLLLREEICYGGGNKGQPPPQTNKKPEPNPPKNLSQKKNPQDQEKNHKNPFTIEPKVLHLQPVGTTGWFKLWLVLWQMQISLILFYPILYTTCI